MQPEQATVALAEFRFTDLGNAERLVAVHGRDLRYAPGLGWFAWDGRRWRRDVDGEPIRRMKNVVRTMYRQAADADDDDTRAKLAKWAAASSSEGRIRAAVSLAETEREVVVQAGELDANPWLFNCANGAVDLGTGELREHHRDDLLTKLSPAVYKPDARSDLWEQSLERTTGSDIELARFLQRAVGYCLTGHTSEEKLFFTHGPTATGKSTLLEAIKTVLGDYASTADFETFLKRHGDAGVRNDIARLAGARLVISIEVDNGKALAEGLLKLLTGGDTVTARFLYHEVFEFMPEFKLWLCANERPRVNAADAAIWRRILQIPFLCQIPEGERDERVKLRLRSDPEIHSAILAWAVQGCLEWQRIGLAVPDAVRDYTAEYRLENDPLRDWLADCCQLDPGEWTPSRTLRDSYETWCSENGEKPVTGKRLAALLKDQGFIEHRTTSARGWLGLAMTMTDDAS